MTQRDVQDHWNSLVNQLGAEPQLSPSPTVKKSSETPQRRAVNVSRVRPPSTDWAEVAVQLGVVGPEPIAEARKWRLRESAQPAPREAVREKPAEKRVAGGFGGGISPEIAPPRDEAAAAAIEESSAAAAPWLEEIQSEEEAPQERRRRRKRRRSRGDRGERAPGDEARGERGEAAGDLETAAASERDVEGAIDSRRSDIEPGEQREPPERDQRGEDTGIEAERGEGPRGERERGEGEADEDRARRGRRRRGRRGDRRDRDEGGRERGPRPQRAAEGVRAETAEGVRSEAAEVVHPPRDDEEEEDAEDQEARAEDHRNIPAWQEAIGIIIDKNMEARAKNPHPYRSRGRGRGRG